MARKSKRRLPKAVKKAIEEQQRQEYAAEVLEPIQRQPAVLERPPTVRRAPLLLPASTSTDSEALVPSRASARPDELLRTMGQQVLVGQQIAGACDFWIELKEEILGGLQIRLSLAGGRLSASLIAKSRDTERLLIRRLPELETQLRQRGMNIAQLEVVVFEKSAVDSSQETW